MNVVLAAGLLAGGAGVGAWLVATRVSPPHVNQVPRPPVVATLEVRTTVFDAPIIGQGNLRPEKQVQIVPHVNGKLVFSHPALAEGNIIPRGSVLFEIDPVPYASQVRQAEANVRRLEASILRQREELAALDARLEISDRMLEMAEKDFLASKSLGDKTYSGAQLHADEALYLKQKEISLELRTRRKVMPLAISETEAQLDAARAVLAQANHDMEHTRIVCPFDARVDSVTARSGQYVTALLAIATLTDISSFEIPAIVEPRELRWVHDAIVAATRGEASADEAPTVTVRWSLFGREFSCQGRVRRFERVDETTRAARLVVAIQDVALGMAAESDGSRPVISIGTFCRTEIPTRPLRDAIVVPRYALQEDAFVYVFEPDPRSADPDCGKLGMRRVTPLRAARGEVLVRYEGSEVREHCELAEGDEIILTPLSRPVIGMSLRRANRDSSLASRTVDNFRLAGGDRPDASFH